MRLMCTIPCQAFPPLVRDSVRVQVLLGPGQTSLEASGSNPKAPGLGWELGRELRELARDLPDSWSGSLRIRDSPGIFRTSTEIQAHTHTHTRTTGAPQAPDDGNVAVRLQGRRGVRPHGCAESVLQ